MGRFNYYNGNFSGGEVSPKFIGRLDTQQYANSVAKLENMLLFPQGGVGRRPGTRYTATVTGMIDPFMIPFIISKTESYNILLSGDDTNASFIKIFSQSGTAASVTINAFLPVIPSSLDKRGWQYAQSASTIWIVHTSGLIPPLIIYRRAVNNFLVQFPTNNAIATNYYATQIPYLDTNADPEKCLRVSTITPGAATLFAETSAGVAINFFSAASVGSIYKLSVSGSAGFFQVAAFVSISQVTGFVSAGVGANTRSDNWEESAWSTKNGWPRSVSLHQQRLVFGGTTLEPDTIYSSLVGNPYFFMQRHLPQDALSDVSGLHYPGPVSETDPYSFLPASKEVNPIQWISAGNDLASGTLGAEYVISANGLLSNSNIEIKTQTGHGSAPISPVRVNNNLYFVTRDAKRILEFTFDFYSNNYKTTNFNLTADHIYQHLFDAGDAFISNCTIGMISYHENRNIIWVVTKRGTLVGITVNKEAQVIGWHTHTLGGSFSGSGVLQFPAITGLTVLPNESGAYDELHLCVKRTINGSTAYYIERMGVDFNHPLYNNDYTSLEEIPIFTDCSLVINNTLGNPVITGLSHLEGQEVRVMTAGKLMPPLTVSGGQITLPISVISKVVVGLNYKPKVYFQRLEAGGDFGSSQGTLKRIDRVTPRFYKSFGANIGVYRANPLYPTVITQEEFVEEILMNPEGALLPDVVLFTGDIRVNLDVSPELQTVVMITQDDPFPLNILGVTFRGVAGD